MVLEKTLESPLDDGKEIKPANPKKKKQPILKEISPEYSFSFRNDWFDLLAVERTLKSLLQHCSAFLYGPTLAFILDYWKNHSFDYMGLYWQSDISAF